MKKKSIFLILWLILSFSLFAQTMSFQSFLNRNPFSLLNNNKLSMHHSFSFTTQTNGKNAIYFSDYTNHLNYQLSSKLNLKMNLHFVNYGGANFNNGFSNMEMSNSKRINVIPEFILNYSPSDNFHIILQYSAGGNDFHSQNPFYYNYYRR